MTLSEKNAASSSDSCEAMPTLSEILRLDDDGREGNAFALGRTSSENDARASNVAALKRIKASLNPKSPNATRQDVGSGENARVEYPYYDAEIELSPDRVVVSNPPVQSPAPPKEEVEKATSRATEPEIPVFKEKRERSTQEKTFADSVKDVVANANRAIPASEPSAPHNDVSQSQLQVPRSDKSNAAIFRYCVDLINSRASTTPSRANPGPASDSSAERDAAGIGVVSAFAPDSDRRSPAFFNESTFLGLAPPAVVGAK